MDLEFSNTTATLLKEQLTFEQLVWITENTLDRASIKKLKGCRTQLVEDCLKSIIELDRLGSMSEEKKNFSTTSTQFLVNSLKTYIQSSERYPRLKKFLNIIPDHTDGMVGFALIATSALSIVSPPFAFIPLGIFFWILMDLSFNNRQAVRNLQESLFNVENELIKIQEVDNILKNQEAPTPIAIQNPTTSQAGPSTSSNYSAQFYGSIQSESTNQNETHDHPSIFRLT